MIKIYCMPLGAYQTNCYLVHNTASQKCVVIDPGYEAHTIMDKADALGLDVEAILLTHGHFDHVGAVRDLAATTGCKVYIRPEETTMPPQLTGGPLYYTDEYPAHGQLTVADINFTVVPTPGHTPGSVCLLAENAMFSGDTLFAGGGFGRTDLPGGDFRTLEQSLIKIITHENSCIFYPGHGEPTELEKAVRDFSKK